MQFGPTVEDGLPNHTEIEMRVVVWSDYLGDICLISINGNNDMPLKERLLSAA